MRASAEVASPIVWLDERSAADETVTGAKAAALARAKAARLPVLPGFVLSTRSTAPCLTGELRLLPGLEPDVRAAWERLSDHGRRALVVRSSSTAEDGNETSMAGQFTSVLQVDGWSAFLPAVEEVLASSMILALDGETPPSRSPMAVLVQPMLDSSCGGVLFGADPLTGDTSYLTVAAVAGGPDQLVHGGVDGTHHKVSRRGRLLGSVTGSGGVTLDRATRRGLARLARRAEVLAGGPQDIEWSRSTDGELWLLQSRPITALPPRPARGPVLGPGPVAETFPDVLAPLEVDLWIAPLAEGVRRAISLTGAVSASRLARSPAVTTVDGQAVGDLELLGAWHPPKRWWSMLDLRPPTRKLAAAWRVGRLRAALPALARDVCAELDRQLVEVPRLDRCSDGSLLDVMFRTRQALAAVHGYEVLLGMDVDPHAEVTTGSSLALRVLGRERAAGNEDDLIVQEFPVVLALTAPIVGPPTALPAVPTANEGTVATAKARMVNDERALLREALRLRARWLQELSARAAWALGGRMAGLDLVSSAERIRVLRLDELTALVKYGITPGDLDGREMPRGASLPSAFRLSAEGTPIPVATPGGRQGGTAASAGRARGEVHDGIGTPSEGAVLVVQSLDPRLAPLLPRIGAIVAETGSPLSHLAILAREMVVPVVVGVTDAVAAYPPGTVLDVDGDTGSVHTMVIDAGVKD